MTKKLIIIGVVAAVLVAIAVANYAAEPPRRGNRLADVPVVTLDGSRTNLLALLDGRVAIIKFGATWCGWCTRQHGELNRVIETFGDRVAVVDIDIRESADRVTAYLQRHGFQATTVLDPEGQAARAYGVRGIPLTLVADHTGRILYAGAYTPFDRLRPILEGALRNVPQEQPAAESPPDRPRPSCCGGL